MSEQRKTVEMEIFEDDSFSFDGFQVVRGEFFAHIYEPSITFADSKVYVNTACIRKLPEFDYIQILVNPDQKKLAVRPCMESEKDSFRWCSATVKRSPKQITCRIFFGKVFSLMGWDSKDRYKILGKLIKAENQYLFVYDLTAPEVFKREVSENGKTATSRMPNYPEDWQTQFGLPVSEHQSGLIVNIFNDTAVFGLEREMEEESKKTQQPEIQESEVPAYEQLSITDIGTAGDHDDRSQEAPASPLQICPA